MKIDESKEFIRDFLLKAGFSVSDIVVEERAEKDFSFNIVSDKADEMIGHRGEVLMALHHILKNVLRLKEFLEDEEQVKIDVNSYRLNQESRVLEIADTYASQVIENGKSLFLPPMSPFFRRLVHLHVKERYPQLVTYSEGQGNYRSVCISSAQLSSEDRESADLYMDIDM